MNLVKKATLWGDAHYTRWITGLRVLLGIIILAKGISFVNDREAVAALIERTNFQLSIWMSVHYIIFAHIVGGLFIILGFKTRLAAVFQLPILLGAVFFVHISTEFSFLYLEFWFSLFVLILLFVFIVFGSEQYSLDNMMNKPGYEREI